MIIWKNICGESWQGTIESAGRSPGNRGPSSFFSRRAHLLTTASKGKQWYGRYDYRNKDTDNSRNGHSSKTLRTSYGDVEVAVPRDRKGEFEPQILKKNQTSVS